MNSTLIRFTSSRFLDSYLNGDLYLSSLKTYWDIEKGKVKADDLEAGKVTEERLAEAIKFSESRHQDISEGTGVQVKKDIMAKVVPEDASIFSHAVYDARFRIDAYKYVNLLCFYRVDSLDGNGGYQIDDEALYTLAEAKMPGRYNLKEISELPTEIAINLAQILSEKNVLLSPFQYHIVQLPPVSMDTFGDVVIVIRDKTEFVKRVTEAVKRQGGDVVLGNVSYHDMMDRLEPIEEPVHTVSVVCDHLFDMSCVLNDRDDVIHYGSLDKYFPYIKQKEWRVSWLPEEHNTEAKVLHCGSLKDIIDVVETKNIRPYLLKKYAGYLPGIIEGLEGDKHCEGTISYRSFMDKVEHIDGLGQLMFEAKLSKPLGMWHNAVYGGKKIDPSVILG